MDSKPRNIQLDFLKTVAIIEVCYCHYGTLCVDSTDLSMIGIIKILIRLFACTAVPVFFTVNGALMLNKNYTSTEILKRAGTLLRKIIIYIPITAFGYAYLHDGVILSVKELLYRWYHWHGNGVQHLWFLFSLLTIYILYPFINMIYTEKRGGVKSFYLGMLFILTFGNSCLNLLHNLICDWTGVQAEYISDRDFFDGVNYAYGWYSFVIVYFILGAILIKRKFTAKEIIGAIFMLLCSSVFYVWMCYRMAFFTGDITYMVYFWGYNQIYMLLIVISIFVLSSKLNYINFSPVFEKLITATGSCTLGVLFFHRFYGEIIRNLFLKHNIDTRTTSLPYGIIAGLSVFLCSFLSTWLLRKTRFGKWLF